MILSNLRQNGLYSAHNQLEQRLGLAGALATRRGSERAPGPPGGLGWGLECPRRTQCQTLRSRPAPEPSSWCSPPRAACPACIGLRPELMKSSGGWALLFLKSPSWQTLGSLLFIGASGGHPLLGSGSGRAGPVRAPTLYFSLEAGKGSLPRDPATRL